MTAQVTAQTRRPGRAQRDSLTAQSWVSPRSGKPHCVLRWGGKEGKLSMEETRALGMALIGIASAAEADAAVLRAMREEMQLDDRTSVQVLSTVQGYRKSAAALTRGNVTVYSGCPYPGAHAHPLEDEDEDEQESGPAACGDAAGAQVGDAA